MKYILYIHNTHIHIHTDIQNSWTQNILYIYESYTRYLSYVQRESGENNGLEASAGQPELCVVQRNLRTKKEYTVGGELTAQ